MQEECESLVRAGVLSSRTERNRHLYRLVRREEVVARLGGLPEALPDWTGMLRVASTLVQLERRSQTLTARTLDVRAAKAGELLREDLEAWDVELPSPARWTDLTDAGRPLLRQWAAGK